MTGTLLGSYIVLGIFIAGLIYHAGQVTQRLAALEEWRRDVAADLKMIRDGISRLEIIMERRQEK